MNETFAFLVPTHNASHTAATQQGCRGCRSLNGSTERLGLGKPSTITLSSPTQCSGRSPTFESLRGSGSAVLIGVELEGQPAVGLLQLLLGGIPLHAKDLVIVPAALYPGSAHESGITASARRIPSARHPLGPRPGTSPPRRPHRLGPRLQPPQPSLTASRHPAAPPCRSWRARGSPTLQPLTARRPGPPAPPSCARRRRPGNAGNGGAGRPGTTTPSGQRGGRGAGDVKWGSVTS